MPVFGNLPSAAAAIAGTTAAGITASQPTTFGGALQRLSATTLNTVTNLAPALTSAFLISRAAGDSAINRTLAATQAPISQDIVNPNAVPPTAAQLGEFLNGPSSSSGFSIDRNSAIAIAGGAALLLVALR